MFVLWLPYQRIVFAVQDQAVSTNTVKKFIFTKLHPQLDAGFVALVMRLLTTL